MKHATRRIGVYLLLALVAAAVLTLDQVTKSLVRQHLPLYEPYMPIEWLEPIVVLRHIHNTGAAFGLFPGGATIFMGVAVLVVLGIIYYYGRLDSPPAFLRVAMGLQLGGALGNFVDRLMHDGAVTDFIDFGFWPVFNVADSSIVVGTIILAWFMLFHDRPEPEEAESRADAGCEEGCEAGSQASA